MFKSLCSFTLLLCLFGGILLMANRVEPAEIISHICECLKDTNLRLSTCLRIQALTCNQSILTLIESENLYSIPAANLVLKPKPTLFMHLANGERINPTKWYYVDWFRHLYVEPLLKALPGLKAWFPSPPGAGWLNRIQYYGEYLKEPGGSKVRDFVFTDGTNQNKPARVTHYMGNNTILFGGFPALPGDRRDLSVPFHTIVSGVTDKSYLVTVYAGRVLFINLNFMLHAFSSPHYPAFALKRIGKSQAQFVHLSAIKNSDAPDFFEASSLLPYGFISAGRQTVVLLDIHSERMILFPYMELKGNGFLPVFKYQTVNIRKAIDCSNAARPDAPGAGDDEATDKLNSSDDDQPSNTTLWLTLAGILLVGGIIAIISLIMWRSTNVPASQHLAAGRVSIGSRVQNLNYSNSASSHSSNTGGGHRSSRRSNKNRNSNYASSRSHHGASKNGSRAGKAMRKNPKQKQQQLQSQSSGGGAKSRI